MYYPSNEVWITPSPTIAGGCLFGADMDYSIYCLNAVSGNLIWNFDAGGSVVSSPAVSGDSLYCGSIFDLSLGTIYCLSTSTGTQQWHYNATARVDSSPAVVAGLVYVGSDDGKVMCLDAAAGDLVWNYTAGPPVWNYDISREVLSSPAISGGRLYVGCDDGNVYCLTTASIPPAPTLNVPSPTFSTNGTVTLSWSAVPRAAAYNLYRSTSPITASSGSLTLVGSFTSLSAQDKSLPSGTYYYVVTAVNATGESPISNCQSCVAAPWFWVVVPAAAIVAFLGVTQAWVKSSLWVAAQPAKVVDLSKVKNNVERAKKMRFLPRVFQIGALMWIAVGDIFVPYFFWYILADIGIGFFAAILFQHLYGKRNLFLVAAYLRKTFARVDLAALASQTSIAPSVMNSFLTQQEQRGLLPGYIDWGSSLFIPVAPFGGAARGPLGSFEFLSLPHIPTGASVPEGPALDAFLADIRALHDHSMSTMEAQGSIITKIRIFIPIFFAGVWVLCWLTMPFEFALAATIETGCILPLMLLATYMPQLQKRRSAKIISLATQTRFSEVASLLSASIAARTRATQTRWPLKSLATKNFALMQPTFDLEGRVLEQMQLNADLQVFINQLTLPSPDTRRPDILAKMREVLAKSETRNLRIHPLLDSRIRGIQDL
jgi:hypothetical protein